MKSALLRRARTPPLALLLLLVPCVLSLPLLLPRLSSIRGGLLLSPRETDWWLRPEVASGHVGTFNKSIFYVKPHKTASESFKNILLAVSDFYNLTDSLRAPPSEHGHDVLVKHQRYRVGVTEGGLRGWKEGEFRTGPGGSPAIREMVRVVTIRNPVDRIFSHYFSQRRFGNFVPSRGHFRKGTLSQKQEINDFEEWLGQYASEYEVRYLMNEPAERADRATDADALVERVQRIVGLYDHVVVADQWRLSLCLFGFSERILPQLLQLKSYNRNFRKAKRFDVDAVVRDPRLYALVLDKIRYDFVLYKALFAKFVSNLDRVDGEALQRYCALVK